jgi:cell division transport system permease protein
MKQSLQGLFKNSIMSITSILFLTLCLVWTGCSVLLILNVDLNLRQLDTLNKIVLFIDKSCEDDEDIERIKQEIDKLPNVKSWRFIPKAEALESLREDFGGIFDDPDIFDRVYNKNPIDNSIEIEYLNIDDVGTLDYQLRTIDGGIHKIRNQVEIADFISNIRHIIMLVLVGFMILLFVSAIFIILNMVRLSVHARKQEIIIMRYIGATNFFILFPFLLEGIIMGIISAVLAFVAQAYIYAGAVSAVGGMEMSGGIEFIEFSEVNIALFAAFVFTGVVCGLLGSGLSSRKYLKA